MRLHHHFLFCLSPVWGFAPRNFLLSSKAPSLHGKLFQVQATSDESYWKSQRQELVETIARIDAVQIEVRNVDAAEDLQQTIDSVQMIEKDVEEIVSSFLSPKNLSMDEYVACMKLVLQLPPPARLALVKALEIEDEAAGDLRRIPEIVDRLYTERQQLTPKLLSDSMQLALTTTKAEKAGATPVIKTEDAVSQLFDEKSREEMLLESNTSNLLGTLTKTTEEKMPTEEDLKTLTNAMDNSIFSPSAKPIKFQGGYMIPGQNRKSNGDDLIQALDSKLPTDWDFSVSYISDITSEDLFDERSNVLILYNKDFAPSNKWVYSLSTLCALGTTLLFAFGIFGSNDAVLNRLTESTSLGDFSGLDFLNGQVLLFIIPLLSILFSHELGHFLVSRKEKIQTASLVPTFLPFFNSLPLFGSLTRITSSPRNRSSLFDFAVAGPLFGFTSSLAFAIVGLLATKSAFEGNANAAEFLPALPVETIKLSTLGSALIDVLGGDGYINSQDPGAAIRLHPFFIAGYCGILINAVEMLPLGSNDGGRLSMSLFGRQGHSVVGGLTWLALLVASFTLEERQGELLVTAWIVNNIVQNEQEIPCRDETDKVDPTRVVLCFGLWFLAAVTLVPMA